MSRVFEALARAEEEKRGEVQPPVEKLESNATVEKLVEENPPEHYPKASGAITRTNGAVHETHKIRRYSSRTAYRFQES